MPRKRILLEERTLGWLEPNSEREAVDGRIRRLEMLSWCQCELVIGGIDEAQVDECPGEEVVAVCALLGH